MKLFIKTIPALFLIMFLLSCKKEKEEQVSYSDKNGVEYSFEKDARIQQYNLDRQKKLAANRSSCDTLSLKEYVLNNYPIGTYLLNSDKTLNYSIPKPAVIYYNQDERYIFCVIAKSRAGERLIEPTNIIGYDQSFIDLDSAELGTAFFYLSLFKCFNDTFEEIWEALIPSHGGFNTISYKQWDKQNIPYIEVNFHYGRGSGHINYNYFLLDDINNKPHLLMTYKGINFKRTIANVNDDNYPDYYEYIYYDLGDRVYSKDSVAFVWKENDSVYVNTRNQKQTRLY